MCKTTTPTVVSKKYMAFDMNLVKLAYLVATQSWYWLLWKIGLCAAHEWNQFKISIKIVGAKIAACILVWSVYSKVLRLQPVEHEAVHRGVVQLGVGRTQQLTQAQRRVRVESRVCELGG